MVQLGHHSTDHLPSTDERITRWVKDVWPHVLRDLIQEHGWEVLIPPTFTDPGTALYWQPRTVVKKADKAGEEDEVQVFHEPVPLPANTASQIANRLKKGCLFQPPMMESVRFVGRQDTPPRETPSDPELKFFHRVGRDIYNFQTWHAYVAFCNARRLPVNPELCPDDVKERLSQFPYSCIQHNVGFVTEQAARDHYRSSLRKPGRATHITPEQMRT